MEIKTRDDINNFIEQMNMGIIQRRPFNYNYSKQHEVEHETESNTSKLTSMESMVSDDEATVVEKIDPPVILDHEERYEMSTFRSFKLFIYHKSKN